MKRAITATVVAAAALAVLAGCSMGAGSSEQSSGDGGVVVVPGAPDEGVSGEGGSDGSSGGYTGSDGDLQSRDVVTTGRLGLVTEDPIAAAARAVSIVEGVEGRVDSRSEQPELEGQAAGANLVLRIPSSEFDATVAQLKDLGDVQYFTTEGDDVTAQRQDIDARIQALETSTARLEQLMAQSATTADLLDIENALSQRQSELDQLTTQRDALADQIDYSTLTVYIGAPGTIAPGGPDTFWDGVVAGWKALVAFIGGALVVFGVFLPWLGLVALIGAIVFGSIRLARRGRPTPPDAVDPARLAP